MKIEHIAIWSEDIEVLKAFYEKYFKARANQRYENPAKGFSSYFLTFRTGARLEIMQMKGVEKLPTPNEHLGLAHFAISVGSEARVNELTAAIKADGYPVVDGPRRTGDGYYESVVLDPEGNRIEITI